MQSPFPWGGGYSGDVETEIANFAGMPPTRGLPYFPGGGTLGGDPVGVIPIFCIPPDFVAGQPGYYANVMTGDPSIIIYSYPDGHLTTAMIRNGQCRFESIKGPGQYPPGAGIPGGRPPVGRPGFAVNPFCGVDLSGIALELAYAAGEIIVFQAAVEILAYAIAHDIRVYCEQAQQAASKVYNSATNASQSMRDAILNASNVLTQFAMASLLPECVQECNDMLAQLAALDDKLASLQNGLSDSYSAVQSADCRSADGQAAVSQFGRYLRNQTSFIPLYMGQLNYLLSELPDIAADCCSLGTDETGKPIKFTRKCPHGYLELFDGKTGRSACIKPRFIP